MQEQAQIEIFVSGRVQGVFFRVNARDVARQYGLVGFAKNLDDGRVHIVAEGNRAALQNFLDWCYRGSLLARVDGLSFTWKSATNKYSTFTVHFEESLIEDKKKALTNLGKRILKRFETKVPKHLVIIPDGNRRWAKEKGLQPWDGHQEGMVKIKELLEEAKDLGVRYITFWGFSTENWKRDQIEVDWLMQTFITQLQELRQHFLDQKIRFHHFGRRDRLPKELVSLIETLEQETASFDDYHVAIALDYGGRNELVRALESLQQQQIPVSEESISEALDTRAFPDVDLIIRTSGEMRTSGILPWQSVYAEYYFSPVCFPDFSREELQLAVADFGNRKRRFGGS